MVLLKVDPLIYDSSKSYFQIYMIALFFQSFNYSINCILQGLGNSKYPMITTLISGLGNLLLNLLFVIVFKMGVNGLAIATIISTAIATFLGFIKIFKNIKELGGMLKFEFDVSSLKKVSILAIPCIMQQCSLYLSSIVVQPMVNDMGKAISAGYSIAMNVSVFINAFFHSISRSLAAYCSQSVGSKKYDNLAKGIKVGILQQIIFVTPLFLICIIWPNAIYSIFLKNNDPSVLPYAVQFSYVCLPFIYFCSYGNLMHSFYKSVKAVNVVLVETVIFSAVRIGLTYLLPKGDLLFSVYLAYGIAWVIEAIILFVVYKTPIWQTKEMKEYFINKRLQKKKASN